METTIMEVLKNEGWNLDKVSDGIYHTMYTGTNGRFYLQLNLINFNSSLVLGTSYFPKLVEENFISQAAWQLNAINLKISVGSFQVNLKTGEITYRAGMYFFNTPFQIDMARNVLNAVLQYTNQYYSAISGLPNNGINRF